MKKDIHPKNYQYVVFSDVNNDFKVRIRSTIPIPKDGKTITWEDGNTYPLIPVHISAASHPFYTGAKVKVDQLGTIAKFNKKYGLRS